MGNEFGKILLNTKDPTTGNCFTILLIFISAFTIAQEKQEIQLNDTARLFGKGIINTGDLNLNASFTPDGKTVFFSKATINFGYIAIFFSTKKGNS